MFLFLLGESKQDDATATAHRKRLIRLLKKQKVLMSTLITIWENTDCCEEQYKCASELYLMSALSQSHSIIIDRGISAPGHCKEVIGGLKAIDRRYMYQIISNYQHPGSKTFD